MASVACRNMLAMFVVLLAALSLAAQVTITCLEPAEPGVAGAACAGNRSDGSVREHVMLEIRGGDGRLFNAADSVQATASSGTVSRPRFDDTGRLRIEWSGPVPPTDTVRLSVSVRDGGWTALREVRLLPPPARSALRLERFAGDGQYWYVGQQLRRPISVRIDPVADAEQCRATVVIFRAGGPQAAASPDSVYGRWSSEPPTGGAGLCYAETRWRLAGELGEQHLRARLAREPGQQQVFTAHARARPRFLAGLAVTSSRTEWAVADSTWTGRVSSTADGVTIAFDSIARWVRAEESNGEIAFAPTLGIDFPLFAWYPRIRATIAVSVADPREDFFLGLSLLQGHFRLAQEGVGFDVHLVSRLNRAERVRHRAECREAQWRHELPAGCISSGLRLVDGVGILATVDGGQLVTTLLRAFGVTP